MSDKTSKPQSLKEIIPESILADLFGIEMKKDKSRQISYWISQGLKSFKVGDERFFLESDVIDFFWDICQKSRSGFLGTP